MPLDLRHYVPKPKLFPSRLSTEAGIASSPPRAKFNAEPMTLAWLDNFASGRPCDKDASAQLENLFPWLWNPSWGNEIGIGVEEVQKLKLAVQQAESMVKSLEGFFKCSNERLSGLRKTLVSTAAKTFFRLLPDDVLALIFEFASMPSSKGDIWNIQEERDIRTPTRISQVSRRFRDIAINLPYLWTVLDLKSHTLENVHPLVSRSVAAGPILEVQIESEAENSDGQNQAFFKFFDYSTTLSSRISSLTLKFPSFTERQVLEKLQEQHAFLSFPSLRELVLDFGRPQSRDADIPFYENWSLPSIKELRLRNVVPRFRSNSVLAHISHCSLAIETNPFGEEWAFDKVTNFLVLLSEVQILDLLLNGDVFSHSFDFTGSISLPTVVHLVTSFPEMDTYLAKSFCHLLKTPNKQRWTLEIEADESAEFPMLNFMWFVFPAYDQWHRNPDALIVDHELKELDVIFRCRFGKENWDDIKKIPLVAKNLDRLSISYAGVQRRKFDLTNCEGGRLEKFVDILEDRVDKRFGDEVLVSVEVDDSDRFSGDEDSESQGSVGGNLTPT